MACIANIVQMIEAAYTIRYFAKIVVSNGKIVLSDNNIYRYFCKYKE